MESRLAATVVLEARNSVPYSHVGHAIACLFLVATIGCASIDHVSVTPHGMTPLTTNEAQQVWAEALQLGSEQPRTLERMSQVAPMLEEVAHALTKEYDAQWQAAEAWEFIAVNDPRTNIRIDAAKRGLTIARYGQTLLPDRVECHYWYALNVGLLADADRTYGLKGVGEIEAALKQANALDERYDYAGPARILGVLYLRTPAPPVSIGSVRKGLHWLQRASDLFPDYPENSLYLAEALKDNGQVDEACRQIQKVLEAKLWPAREFESAHWKDEARKILPCRPAK